MNTVLVKLEKILALEKQKAFGDKAVIGGLEPFVIKWIAEARTSCLQDFIHDFTEEIRDVLAGYSALRQDDRPGRIRDALRLLEEAKKGEWRKVRLVGGPVAPPQLPKQSSVPRQRKPAKAANRPSEANLSLESPIQDLKGLTAPQAKLFNRLGVVTIRDLLYFFPRRYNDFSSLKRIHELNYGQTETVIGRVIEVQTRRSRQGRPMVTATIADETGAIQATWFNQPYLVRNLPRGRPIVISGRVDQFLGRLSFNAPEWEPWEEDLTHTGRLVPVYPLTEGLWERNTRKLIKAVVDRWTDAVADFLPRETRERQRLFSLPTALRQIHFPESSSQLELAQRRLAFDEFLLIRLAALIRKRRWQESAPAAALVADQPVLCQFLNSLPFSLTKAQRRALDQILADLEQTCAMSRLVQGDVGSGKTVIAVACLLMAVANGFQGVFMAPTEILAEQHYKSVSSLLGGIALPDRGIEEVQVGRLTGSLSRVEKDELYAAVSDGRVSIVVGTHALIEEGVEFQRLGLAVIDEQHRFGVLQRASLRQKGYNPHVLVMTATPIPRSLALTLYGDLDISVIDEMPPGRQEIRTARFSPGEREDAYEFIRQQVDQGRQAFIICPLVEESEKIEAKAATVEYRRLQTEVFPNLRLGLLHGRMKGPEKDTVMKSFRSGELDVLVSTSVVEVGIDIPNATVMLVEGADRFGLAQLHQFRGRVGRGDHQSYCILLSDSDSDVARKRLSAMEGTSDGFALAEIDLELRGPGEMMGTRQSGMPDLKIAKLSDVRTLELARDEASNLLERDPELGRPEHQLLKRQVEPFMRGYGDIS